MKNSVKDSAHAIAIELVKRDTDPNELAKVATYSRTHADGVEFFRFLEAMTRDGRYFARSRRTLDYYRDIQDVCQQHLGSYRKAKTDQAHDLAEILGWTIRLMRYYKSVGVPATERTPTKAPEAPTRAARETRQPPQPQSPKEESPQQDVMTTKREAVTLMENAKRGKASVKTGDGQQVVCSGFLPYPVPRQGMRCRADVTRQNGNVQRATFKRWE